VPSACEIDDEVLHGMNALRRQSFLKPHGIERSFIGSPVTQRFNDRAIFPSTQSHPSWAITNAQARPDHCPGRFSIIKAMDRTRQVSDRTTVGRIAKSPTVELLAHRIAETDQCVIGKLRRRFRLTMGAEIIR
jgi:hypothetical protein